MENLEKADIVTLALSLRHELDASLLARSFHVEESDIKDIFNGYDSGMDTAILYVIKDLRELYQFSREDIETLFANTPHKDRMAHYFEMLEQNRLPERPDDKSIYYRMSYNVGYEVSASVACLAMHDEAEIPMDILREFFDSSLDLEELLKNARYITEKKTPKEEKTLRERLEILRPAYGDEITDNLIRNTCLQEMANDISTLEPERQEIMTQFLKEILSNPLENWEAICDKLAETLLDKGFISEEDAEKLKAKIRNSL